MAKRSKRPRKKRAEFKETLGITRPVATPDIQLATYVSIWIVLTLAILALSIIIIANLIRGSVRPASNIPAGTVIPLSGASVDFDRAAQAKTIAQTAGAPPAGQTTAIPPVSSMASGYPDAYIVQGSAGTAAARHPEPAR